MRIFKRQGNHHSRGFTLVEVLVAMSIMVGVIIVVANTWSGNFMRIRKSNLYNNVSFLLERKIAELEAEYRGKPLAEIPEERSGDFGTELPQYSWKLTSQEFQMPDLTNVLISQDQGQEMLVQMVQQTTEYISKSVKEVTISVIVNTGKRDVSYSVTTYFVDYSTEFTGPGGPAAGGQ